VEYKNNNLKKSTLNSFKIILISLFIIALSVCIYINKDTILNSDKFQNKTLENISNTDSKYKLEVPDFELKDVYGNKINLLDYKGKIIFVNFWTSWCDSCLFEIPDLNEINNEYKDKDVVILAISVMETETTIGNFVEAYDYGLKFLLDLDGEVAKLYGAEGYPTTFVIDKNGKLYDKKSDSIDKKYLIDTINKLQWISL